MELFLEILRIVLPAALVLYAVYLVVKGFLNKEFSMRLAQYRQENQKEMLGNRLQAYERMALFLERISPENIFIRLDDGTYTASEFRHILIHQIREEYNHNLAQQIYIGDEVWDAVKTAKESLISDINAAAHGLPPETPAHELSRKILEETISRKGNDHFKAALGTLKNEVRQVLM